MAGSAATKVLSGNLAGLAAGSARPAWFEQADYRNIWEWRRPIPVRQRSRSCILVTPDSNSHACCFQGSHFIRRSTLSSGDNGPDGPSVFKEVASFPMPCKGNRPGQKTFRDEYRAIPIYSKFPRSVNNQPPSSQNGEVHGTFASPCHSTFS